MALEFKFLLGPEVVEAEKRLPENQRVTWPIDSLVMYAVDDERIVGRMGILSLKLIEGTWADEAHPMLGFRMMRQMEAMLQFIGDTHAMAMVYDETPRIGDYLRHAGFERFPITMFCKELVKKEEAA